MDLLAQTNPDMLVLFPETADLLPAGLAMRVASIGADLTGSLLRLDERAASQPGAPVASLAHRVQDMQGPIIYSIGLMFGGGESRHAKRDLRALSSETGGIPFSRAR
jgi:hypothetical protein